MTTMKQWSITRRKLRIEQPKNLRALMSILDSLGFHFTEGEIDTLKTIYLPNEMSIRTVGQQYYDWKFQSATPALMTQTLLSDEGMDDNLKLAIATMIEENKLDDARLALSNWHYENQARG